MIIKRYLFQMARLLWSDFDWPYKRVINWCIRYDEYMNSLAHVNFAFILLQFLCVLDLYACFFCNFLKYFYFDYLHMRYRTRLKLFHTPFIEHIPHRLNINKKKTSTKWDTHATTTTRDTKKVNIIPKQKPRKTLRQRILYRILLLRHFIADQFSSNEIR